MNRDSMIERTLVLIKPDGMARAMTGKVLSIFEDAGLKIVAAKLLKPTEEIAKEHYPYTDEWAKNVWEKSKKSYDEKGIPFRETIEQIGNRIRNALLDLLVDKPVLAFVIEGNEAISCVRKIVGATAPSRADPSTIRGRYSTDSYDMADKGKRSVRNIVHASEDKANADREIKIWFKKDEIIEYKRCDEDAMSA